MVSESIVKPPGGLFEVGFSSDGSDDVAYLAAFLFGDAENTILSERSFIGIQRGYFGKTTIKRLRKETQLFGNYLADSNEIIRV